MMAFLTVFWIWSRVSFFGFIFTSLRQKAGDGASHLCHCAKRVTQHSLHWRAAHCHLPNGWRKCPANTTDNCGKRAKTSPNRAACACGTKGSR
jgi:hypothetical protein